MGSRFLIALVALMALGNATASPAQSDAPMTFHADLSRVNRLYSNDIAATGLPIYADGIINVGTTDRLLSFIKLNKIEVGRIYFNSGGGSLLEGIKLGRAIRKLQLYTSIGVEGNESDNRASFCASACAYAFAGGISRFLDASTGRLGIHQFYSAVGDHSSEGETQLVAGLLAAYLNDMGIDARAFALASVTEHEGILWLTPSEAAALGFANNGVQPTEAQIKINGMMPYLRLEQTRYNVTSRYLFFCDEGAIEMGAGVVTNPETSALHAQHVTKAYLELDGTEYLARTGPAAVTADDSVVWLRRPLPQVVAQALLKTRVADIWIENGSGMRWGGPIDLSGVHQAMKNYFQQCYK